MCTFWSFLCIIVSITWQKFPWKNCPDVRECAMYSQVTRESSRTYNPLWRWRLSRLFFDEKNPRGTDEQTSSLSSILSSQSVWAQCHFEDALSFLPLGHALPVFIFSPCSSPWKWGAQSQPSLGMTSPHCHATSAKRPWSHWRPLNWPLWLVLCSCPAPKLEAFDADKKLLKFHFWHPARSSSL